MRCYKNKVPKLLAKFRRGLNGTMGGEKSDRWKGSSDEQFSSGTVIRSSAHKAGVYVVEGTESEALDNDCDPKQNMSDG